MDKQPKKNLFFKVLYGAILIGAIQNMDTFGKVYHHQTSFPYVTGDTIRALCDHIIDSNTIRFNPSLVSAGDTIFVKTNHVGWFFTNIHPRIMHPYILVTHNADRGVPGIFISYLKDNKLLAWFGQNAQTGLHKKLCNLPIGLANSHWRHGNISLIKCVQAQRHEKKYLLYMNFSRGNHKPHRDAVYNLFRNQSYCYCQGTKAFEAYLTDMAQSKFVLSPPGNGEDCHRTWEALYVGAIPVVQTSFLDPMFDGLPVLIINDWSVITEEFLEQKYQEMSKKKYSMNKLYAPYWLKKIEAIQSTVR